MNEQVQTSFHTRLPIIFQLGVLLLILGGIFSSVLLPAEPKTEPIAVTDVQQQQPAQVEQAISVPQKIDELFLYADAAFVWDVRQQRVLYSKNADEALPLASITKLMTSLLAYELTADDTPATVGDMAVRQEGNSGLFAGEEFTMADLRELALISSSNDAAYALAASVGQLLGTADPDAQFVTGMNIRAEELGFSSLNFKNTTGLDVNESVPGAVGSAKDVSFLMEYIVNNYPELLSTTRIATTRVYNQAGEYHEISNTNEILEDIPNLIGSKTGYTDLAGGNLTIAFDLGLDRPIVVTVLGSTYDGRFEDVLSLVEAVQDSVNTE